MANTSPEFKFARDVIRYVLTEYWPGTHWNPSGIFVEYDHDSPCTPDVQYMIKKFLDENGVELHQSYDEYFRNKNIPPQQHYEFCQEITSSLIMINESAEAKCAFLTLCASLSLFTALSVVYGVNVAPVITHRLILHFFTSLQNREFITDTFWMDLQTFCEQY
ncbi:uncharacterized protein TNIN_189661 [Trichonephila inaurata madagascariensis]|uniref:Uncharacterized protein n=1 Tax=Trichonephila inaurata madagascariensis TaxID=2747483 RepID=A0A8X6MD16_9ARAC|nr:uncharacterized protein TNIN_189661 [Trichonephila inaurata madagascariensis]